MNRYKLYILSAIMLFLIIIAYIYLYAEKINGDSRAVINQRTVNSIGSQSSENAEKNRNEINNHIVRLHFGFIMLASIDYFNDFGYYPSGKNHDIMKKLVGHNGHGETYLIEKKLNLNDNFELLDPWGIPYILNLSHDGILSLMSSGKNNIPGDNDDEIAIEDIKLYKQSLSANP